MSVITIRGTSQGDLFNLLQALVNTILDAPGLAVGTTTTKIQITNATNFRIGDVVYSKGATDNITVSGLTNTSATQYRKVRIEINSGGTVAFTEGPAASAQALAKVPRRTASKATLGWVEIPASFTYATSNFNDSGVTFFDGDPDLGDGSGVPPDDRGIEQTVITA